MRDRMTKERESWRVYLSSLDVAPLKRRLNSFNVTIAVNCNTIEVFPDNVGRVRNMKFRERLKV